MAASTQRASAYVVHVSLFELQLNPKLALHPILPNLPSTLVLGCRNPQELTSPLISAGPSLAAQAGFPTTKRAIETAIPWPTPEKQLLLWLELGFRRFAQLMKPTTAASPMQPPCCTFILWRLLGWCSLSGALTRQKRSLQQQ